MQPASFHAVVFDLGNTLWFAAASRPEDEIYALEAERVRPLLDEWGIHLPLPVEGLVAEVWAALDQAYEVELERRTYRDPSIAFLWRGALGVRGVEITLAQSEALWRAAWFPARELRPQLYPESLDVLGALRSRGLRIGLNTTRPCTSEMLMPDLADYGLLPYVDAVVCSGDVGYFKPHPAPFKRALALLDVAPREAVMVGDSAAGDMRGARLLGMTTVWKLNGRYGRPPCADADFEIHDLGELLSLPMFSGPRSWGTESPMPHEDGNAERW